MQMFKNADRILMGEIMVKVIPRREYMVKAGATGEIKLNPQFMQGMVEAGQELGGIDMESLLLQKELLEIEESFFRERKLPQSKLQRISEIEKFKERLLRLQSETKLTQKFIDDPVLLSEVYREDVGEGNFSKELQTTLKDMNETQKILTEVISYYENKQFQDLEVKEASKKLKIKRLQFEAREREACLTVPFAGEVQILYPYQTGERNYVTAGVDIARVRDIENIYADAQIFNSKWRLIPKSKLNLELQGTKGLVNGRYLESRETINSGKPNLSYRFAFPKEKMEGLRPLLDGMVNAKLYFNLGEDVRLAPKFLLVAMAPDLFRKNGWEGLITKIFPGHELVQVGLNQVAIRSIVSKGVSNSQ